MTQNDVEWIADGFAHVIATQPFQEILHERVLKYQDSLFEARTLNVNARKELPVETAEVSIIPLHRIAVEARSES